MQILMENVDIVKSESEVVREIISKWLAAPDPWYAEVGKVINPTGKAFRSGFGKMDVLKGRGRRIVPGALAFQKLSAAITAGHSTNTFTAGESVPLVLVESTLNSNDPLSAARVTFTAKDVYGVVANLISYDLTVGQGQNRFVLPLGYLYSNEIVPAVAYVNVTAAQNFVVDVAGSDTQPWDVTLINAAYELDPIKPRDPRASEILRKIAKYKRGR